MKIKFVLIFTTIFLVGCFESESNIDKVKNGALSFNQTTTVGKALDNYKICNDKKWNSFKTNNDIEVVEFICIKNDVKNAMNKSDINPKLTSVKEVFQFAIKINGGFQLHNAHQEYEWTDGKKAIISGDAIDRLKVAYENPNIEDFLGIFSGFMGAMANNMARREVR